MGKAAMSKQTKQPFGTRALKTIQRFFPKVDHVEDATKPLVIEVTKKDNESAAVKKHDGCALAVACKRKTKADGVIVGTTTAYIINGDEAIRYKLLGTTTREIVSNDRGAGFDVGVYPLKVPGKYNKLGAKRPHWSPSTRGKGRGNPNLRHYTTGIRTVLGSTVGAA